MKLGWDDLPELFPQLPDQERWLPLLQLHARLLAEAAPQVRTTSVSAEDEVRRNYAESLELAQILLAHHALEGTVVDVGSGGGFPGLVLAAVAPASRFVLVEPLRKRADLLAHVAAEMQLANVETVALRAEEAGRGKWRETASAVTARAVAPLRVLLEYTIPLAQPGGLVVLPKGSGFAAELDAAAGAMTSLSCSFEGVISMRAEVNPLAAVGIFRRTGPLDTRYPRRPGMPAKRPL